MKASGMMFNRPKEWNISFAGCGFRSIYHVGAVSCILQWCPQLVRGASKFGGASSGCLVAAALAVGIPLEQLCLDILGTAREARKHVLGVFHPTFSLLRTVRRFLHDRLPGDAHRRASGKLFVSLTRLADGQNVVVSEFASREELIQVLVCSCFFPVYCGLVPPAYRGVHYTDGALSNNVPLFEDRNTITVAPFSGENDICPKEGTFNFIEVTYGNVSIWVNTANVHRICTSFLPPSLERLTEICRNGYKDALFFLEEQDLVSVAHGPHVVLAGSWRRTGSSCEHLRRKMQQNNGRKHQTDICFQPDQKVSEKLPASIQKALHEACRDSPDSGTSWSRYTDVSMKLAVFILTIPLLPIQLSLLLVKRLWRRLQQSGADSQVPTQSPSTLK